MEFTTTINDYFLRSSSLSSIVSLLLVNEAVNIDVATSILCLMQNQYGYPDKRFEAVTLHLLDKIQFLPSQTSQSKMYLMTWFNSLSTEKCVVQLAEC